jgi:hypothetical protein
MGDLEMKTEQSPFSERELDLLRGFAETAIPASAKYDLPGAGDAAIFADIAAAARRDVAGVKAVLAGLDAIAGGDFLALAADARLEAAENLRRLNELAALALGGLVAACYYRDARVMAAIGMEVRPPFPKGFEVDQGDWSLLDKVRSGPIRYRVVGASRKGSPPGGSRKG